MIDNAVTVAKEITVALIPRAAKLEGKESKNVELGEAAGAVFKGVLKQVMQAVAEVDKRPAE